MKIQIWLVIILGLYPISQAAWPFNLFSNKKPFTLVIEASGDAFNSGRTICNNFENAISFTIAQHIKEMINVHPLHAKIFINRTPTEIIAVLQNAQFANKLNTDLYISIHCYQHAQNRPQITLYQYSYKEPVILKKGSLGFYTFDQIYLLNETQTNTWAQELKKILSEQNHLDIYGTYKLPFKPLMGIDASTIGIEVGICSEQDLPLIITVLSNALEQFIKRNNA
jgi:N-acetylmuramoyl-L-alanine amidase